MTWKFENFHAIKWHLSYNLLVSKIKLSVSSSFQNTKGVKNLFAANYSAVQTSQLHMQMLHLTWKMSYTSLSTNLHTMKGCWISVLSTTNLPDVTEVTSTHANNFLYANSFLNTKLGCRE